MIRAAESGDLPRISEIYRYARRFMAENGNPTQWGATHPPTELLAADIAAGQLFVLEESDGIHAVFAFIIGEDPSYAVIEDGAWLSDAPYGAIHRVASDGTRHGVLRAAVTFCAQRQPHLRIDTHRDNHIMQRRIAANGFIRCGTVYTVEEHAPRIAYERI